MNVFDTNTRTNVKYNANIVLVTLPLGVLKQSYKSMFLPSLPAPKANAIEKLGFGSMNKVFIIYDKPLFKSDDLGFQLYWRADQPNSLPNVDAKCNLAVSYF